VIIDLEEKLRVSELRIKRLVDSKRESEKRIAKIRQAAFGVVDWGIDVE
jgi:chaperonin cofactor prefoldin